MVGTTPARMKTMALHVCRVVGRLSIVAAYVLGSAPGCASEPQQGAPATPAATTADEGRSQAAAAPATSTDAFLGRTDPVEAQRPAIDPAVLSDVRAAAQATFDRVVFEFQTPAVPGYRVAYAEGPVRDCGSGETVDVQGASQLIVRLSPAQAHTETGIVTVKGQERLLALPVLRELQLSCDFEGEVSWVLGLSALRPYRVSELPAPPRLVVDIQH